MAHSRRMIFILLFLSIRSSLFAQTFTKIYPYSPNPSHLAFGKYDLALSGAHLLVGSPMDSSAYLYDLNGGHTLIKRFHVNDQPLAQPDPQKFGPATYRSFGRMVDIERDRMVIGYNYSARPGYQGACFYTNEKVGGGAQIFERVAGTQQWNPMSHRDGGVLSQTADRVELREDWILVSGDNDENIHRPGVCPPFSTQHFRAKWELFKRTSSAQTPLLSYASDSLYFGPAPTAPQVMEGYGRFSPKGERLGTFVGTDVSFRQKTYDLSYGQPLLLHQTITGSGQYTSFVDQILALSDQYALVSILSPSASPTEIRYWDASQSTWVFDAFFPHQGYLLSEAGVIDDKIIVSNPFYDRSRGVVDIFQKDGVTGDWRLIYRFSPPGLDPGDEFGRTLDIDGERLAIGAPGDDSQATDAGAVYIYDWNCVLPMDLQVADIGNHGGVKSQICFDEGTHLFNVEASGNDIYGTQDGCTFIYQPLLGDGEVKMKIHYLDGMPYWNLAGVMFREALDPGSPNAFVGFNGGGGNPQANFQQRYTQGGTTFGTTGSNRQFPMWVKLERWGNDFYAYESVDGNTWTFMGDAYIPMHQEIYVGLAVSSPFPGTVSKFDLSHLTINGHTFKQALDISFERGEMVRDYRSQLASNDHSQHLKVYPTPVQDVLYIEGIPTFALVRLLDVTGRIVWERQQGEEASLTYDLSNWQEGIYFLQVEKAGKSETHKIMKMN
ncbi:MAG: T9SS type A sorting domain-containing protein [Bacteroidota bacterium]